MLFSEWRIPKYGSMLQGKKNEKIFYETHTNDQVKRQVTTEPPFKYI